MIMNLRKVEKILEISYKTLLFELMRHKIYNRYIDRMLFHPSVVLNITDNCNSRCITCNAWRKKSTNELTTDEVIDILHQLSNLNISDIYFGGGEPLLRYDLPKLIQKSKKSGFDRISIITNGLLLNKRKIETLLKSGITAIGISLDGIGDTHDMIRGIKGAYERSSSALKTITKLRDNGYPYLDIWISTTLMRINIHQIERIIEMCNQLNVRMFLNLLDTSPYFFSGVDVRNLTIKCQKELNSIIDKLHKMKDRYPHVLNQPHISLEYARRYFSNPRQEDIPCSMGYHSIYIGAHGEVYSGCWVLKPIGNLRDNKLDEILCSRRYVHRLHDMFIKKCPGCSCGYSKNLVYHLPSICKEISWRIWN